MQIIPTIAPNAKMHGEDVVIRVQDDIDIRMSLHEALSFSMSVQKVAREALQASRYIEPIEAQIIAFPTRAAGRA